MTPINPAFVYVASIGGGQSTMCIYAPTPEDADGVAASVADDAMMVTGYDLGYQVAEGGRSFHVVINFHLEVAISAPNELMLREAVCLKWPDDDFTVEEDFDHEFKYPL